MPQVVAVASSVTGFALLQMNSTQGIKWVLRDSSVLPAKDPSQRLLNVCAVEQHVSDGLLPRAPRRSSDQPSQLPDVMVHDEKRAADGGFVTLDENVLMKLVDSASLELLREVKRISTTAYLTFGGPQVHLVTKVLSQKWKDAVDDWAKPPQMSA